MSRRKPSSTMFEKTAGLDSLDTAVFSPCWTWRYRLTRRVAFGPPTVANTVLFIGLNPSTADESNNDPTVTRMMGFARSWGYVRLIVCNIFAFRATDPDEMKRAANPIGEQRGRLNVNDEAIKTAADESALVVCAWGNHGAFLQRGDWVTKILQWNPSRSLKCLGTNKDGSPKHPLYIRANATPVYFA